MFNTGQKSRAAFGPVTFELLIIYLSGDVQRTSRSMSQALMERPDLEINVRELNSI